MAEVIHPFLPHHPFLPLFQVVSSLRVMRLVLVSLETQWSNAVQNADQMNGDVTNIYAMHHPESIVTHQRSPFKQQSFQSKSLPPTPQLTQVETIANQVTPLDTSMNTHNSKSPVTSPRTNLSALKNAVNTAMPSRQLDVKTLMNSNTKESTTLTHANAILSVVKIS